MIGRVMALLAAGDLPAARVVAETQTQTARPTGPSVLELRAAMLLGNVQWVDVSYVITNDELKVAAVRLRALDKTHPVLAEPPPLDHPVLLEINPKGYHSVDVAWNVLYHTCEVLSATRQWSDEWDRKLPYTYPASFDPDTGDEMPLPTLAEPRTRRSHRLARGQ